MISATEAFNQSKESAKKSCEAICHKVKSMQYPYFINYVKAHPMPSALLAAAGIFAIACCVIKKLKKPAGGHLAATRASKD
jgi:hypothetical protein